MNYHPNGCRFIEDEPPRLENCCGNDRQSGSPYCPDHHQRCYLAGSGRREHPDYEKLAERRRETQVAILAFTPPADACLNYPKSSRRADPKPKRPPKHQKRGPNTSRFASADLSWLDTKIEFSYPHEKEIHALRSTGLSCGRIGKQLGVSKNTVVGKLSRMRRRALNAAREALDG